MISACLLTYNRASVLPATLESLLMQSERDFELLINDNCSTDGTGEVCRRFAERDPRVRYFRNETNVGFAGNMNAAVRRSTRPYIALLHDGDIYSPRLLAAWREAMEANPGAGLVFNAVSVRNEHGDIVGHFDHGFPPVQPGLALYDRMLTSIHSPIWGIVMLRRACLEEVGSFDEELRHPADVEMWFRLLRRYDVAYVNERLYAIHREAKAHARSGINWRYRNEIAFVLRRAVDWRHSVGSREWRQARRRVESNLMMANAFDLANAVRKRDWNAVWEGIWVIGSRNSLRPVRPAPGSA